MKKIIPLKQQEILIISGGTNAANHTKTPEEEKNDNLWLAIGTIQVIAIIWFARNMAIQKGSRTHRRRHQHTPQDTLQKTTYCRATTLGIKIEQPITLIKIEEDYYQ